jgi:hypothetical protein
MTQPAILIPAPPGGLGPPPRRPDGNLHRFELTDVMGRWRAYADEPGSLVGVLISDYAGLGGVERLAARISLAVHVRMMAQERAVTPDGLAGCTAEQLAVLAAGEEQTPWAGRWSAPVPLVLVEGFYEPVGDLPRPVAVSPGEIIWIDPRDDAALLRSLHHVGWVVLAERPEGPR